MFRLAHVTDPHFRSARGGQGIRAGELWGKRAVGYVNLVVNRVRKHKMELLEDLRVDLRAQAPDHLAVTGDLSNIAVTAEWRSALAWLDLSGVAPDAISVIPGNHDAYVPEVLATREFERLFAPYQTSDLDRQGDAESAHYPFVQIREPLALIGVSSAVATGDLGAWGAIGEAQLARLETILKAPELASLTRVVLVHHPPVLHKDGRAPEPARPGGLRPGPRPRRRRPGAARPRSRGPARRAAGTRRSGDPRDWRRLGVVRGRAGAPGPLQRVRIRRSVDHLGEPRSRRGDQLLPRSPPRETRALKRQDRRRARDVDSFAVTGPRPACRASVALALRSFCALETTR